MTWIRPSKSGAPALHQTMLTPISETITKIRALSNNSWCCFFRTKSLYSGGTTMWALPSGFHLPLVMQPHCDLNPVLKTPIPDESPAARYPGARSSQPHESKTAAVIPTPAAILTRSSVELIIRFSLTSPAAAAAEIAIFQLPTTPVLCVDTCLLYTSDAADEEDSVDLGGRRIIKKKKKRKKNINKINKKNTKKNKK
eukprot:TRINITY_DN216_c0_g1_i2.p1 TRINITY_DN216_c0_g1~~TRINITY_DN216_c0_g1_i2.p1  ORF type:complete len:198 (-),score=32.92 TRINITY_DN216_c0_g1_i2:43-636(-)